MRPICTSCEKEMHPFRNGTIVRFEVDGRYHETAQGDMYVCQSCGNGVVSGFGRAYHSPDTVSHITIQV